MFTTMLVTDSRPEAVSSAHWGDQGRFASRRPAAVSSAHWGDVAIASSDASLFEAMLNPLETNALALTVLNKGTQNPPGSPTHNSTNAEIALHQSNASIRKKTGN
jgi:osmoprotectant transport system ATP-binding protein